MPPPNENRNPITQTDTITDRQATQTSVANKDFITNQQNKQALNSKTKPSIEKLFIYDSILDKQVAKAILNAFYSGAKLVSIKNWNDLISTLSLYSRINTLIFYTHSIPGSLLINETSPTLSIQAQKLTSSKVHISNKIIFEGCSIMEDPISVAKLTSGITTDNTEVFGYTLFSITQPIEVSLTGNGDVQQIKDILNPHKIYLLPLKTSYQNLANTKSKVTFYKRWFRSEFNEESMPDILPGDFPPKGIFSRSQLKDTTISTYNDACRFKNDLRTPTSHPYFVKMTNIQKINTENTKTPC